MMKTRIKDHEYGDKGVIVFEDSHTDSVAIFAMSPTQA